MRLYLVRHGMAKSKEEDPERPLNERGISETKRVAAFLAPLKLTVDTIYHSGKARSRETAEIIAGVIASAGGVKQRDGINPDDEVKKFAKEIAKARTDIMIAGHQPFLGKLASYLLAQDQEAEVVSFSLSGVMCLDLGEEGWWHLLWMVVPEILP